MSAHRGVSACGGLCLPGGCLPRGCMAGGCMPKGVCISALRQTPPREQNDRQVSKRYLTATSLRTVITNTTLAYLKLITTLALSIE